MLPSFDISQFINLAILIGAFLAMLYRFAQWFKSYVRGVVKKDVAEPIQDVKKQLLPDGGSSVHDVLVSLVGRLERLEASDLRSAVRNEARIEFLQKQHDDYVRDYIAHVTRYHNSRE